MNQVEEQLAFFPVARPMINPDSHRLNLLALAQVRGLGEITLKALAKEFPDLDEVWDVPEERLRRLFGHIGLRNATPLIEQLHRRDALEDAARRELDRFDRQRIHFITLRDAEYPDRLRDIRDAPHWLFIRGNVASLSLPNLVAIVGTRDASAQGVDVARSFSRWLAEHGFGIVSGLAAGIDQMAHQAAIDFGTPTIGVMGTGIEIVFPVSASEMIDAILADGGAIVTEYLPYESYSAQRFVRRNRIIAGLAYATVPVEAHAKSGTAHTYRFAKAFERLTFGVRRASVPMQNGILQLLYEDRRPIFDLDSEADVLTMETLLHPALKGAPAPGASSRTFNPLLREFERIIGSYAVTDADVEQLKTSLDELWKRMRRGSQSSHSGS